MSRRASAIFWTVIFAGTLILVVLALDYLDSVEIL
jgi:hypothetical protein